MSLRNILNKPSNFNGLIELDDKLLYELQDNLLDMLEDIKTVLDKYHLGWGITAGNALGAVRNNDFIAWDDDIDINMTRSDFNKFKEIFNSELADKYELKLPGDKHYIYHYPQIHKKNTVYKLLQSDADSNDGLFIDIFIIDNCFQNKALFYLHGLLSTGLLFIDSCLRTKACKSNILKYCINKKAIKSIKIRSSLAFPFGFLSLEKWLKLTDKVFEIANDDNSKMVVIPSGANHFFHEIYERDIFVPFKSIKFRNHLFYTHHKVEEYLTIRYGKDYLIPPNKANQESHSIIEYSFKK